MKREKRYEIQQWLLKSQRDLLAANATETLTPYATGFRYPQDAFEPQRNEAETAVEMADSVLAFVVNLLSNDILTAFSEDSTISEDSADDA